MTLSDRLEQARRERRERERRVLGLEPDPADVPFAPDEEASGGLIVFPVPAPPPLDPEEEAAAVAADLESDAEDDVLDLRDRVIAVGTAGGLRSVVTVPPGDTQERCPACHRVARADMADLVGQLMHYSCDTCGTLWQRTDLPSHTV